MVSLDGMARRAADHWLQMATTVGITLIVGLLGWFGLQLVAMRDDIHTLKDALPTLDSRVSRLESRQDDIIQVLASRSLPP